MGIIAIKYQIIKEHTIQVSLIYFLGVNFESSNKAISTPSV
jgi:hypothetical protein